MIRSNRMKEREQHVWDFFFCKLAGKPASVRINLSLLEMLPMETHSQLVYLILPLKMPDRQGMIHAEEARTIREMETDIVRLATLDLNGMYALRYTGKGRRSLYFYLPPHMEVADLLGACMEAYPEYRFSLGVLADPHWNFYRTTLQEDWLQERNLEVPQWEVSADDAIPQEIEHAFRCASETCRRQFMEVAREKNFAVSHLKFSARHQDHPYELTMSRMELNTPKQLSDLRHSLSEIATTFQGLYLGEQALHIG